MMVLDNYRNLSDSVDGVWVRRNLKSHFMAEQPYAGGNALGLR